MPITVKPSEAAEILRQCIATKQPVMMWGSYGIGKSSIVAQVADAMYAGHYGCTVDANGRLHDGTGQYTSNRPWLTDLRLVLLDPTDLRGLPMVNGDGRVHWAAPAFAPKPDCLPMAILLDEINRAPSLVQNAAFQLVLDRKLGEYKLPDNVAIIAAGNRESDGGGVTRMHAALGNRFLHINVEVDLKDWCTWAITAGINPVIIAYVRSQPDDLNSPDSKAQASPTPRSWEFVSKTLNPNLPASIERAMIAGAIGEAVTIKFWSFLTLYRQLASTVSIDAILLDPDNTAVPNDVGSQYAIASGLAQRSDPNNISRVIRYLSRMPREFAVFAVRDAVQRDPSLNSTPAFTQWAVQYQDLM